MKKILAVCVLVILAAFTVKGLAYDLYTLGFDIVDPDSVVFVGKGAWFQDISTAVDECPPGGTVIVWPGTYLVNDVAIGAKNIVGMGDAATEVVWTYSNRAFNITASGANIIGIKFLRTSGVSTPGVGSLGNYSTKFKDCIFDDSTFAMKVTNSTNDMVYVNCQFYPRKTGAFAIDGTSGYCWFRGTLTKFGEPTGYAFNGYADSSAGFRVIGSIASFISDVQIYAYDVPINVGGGMCALYGDAIIKQKTAYPNNNVNAKSAITVSNDATFFMMNGGIVTNSSTANPVISVLNTATATVINAVIVNKCPGGPVYTSTSTGISDFNGTVFGGGRITQWGSAYGDKIDWEFVKGIVMPPAAVDSIMLFYNNSKCPYYIESLMIWTAESNDSLIFAIKSSSGVFVSYADTIGTGVSGTGCFVGTEKKSGSIDNDSLAAGQSLWLVNRDVTTPNPTWIYYNASLLKNNNAGQ